MEFSDNNQDGFLDYILNPRREFGGLINQNWMDSTEATFHEDGVEISYPIAPVEAQSYAYLALIMWGKYFKKKDKVWSLQLTERAKELKRKFNQAFVLEDSLGTYLASGIDGKGKLLKSARSSMGHTLWAALNLKQDREINSILENKLAPKIVKRLMQPDLFVPEAGVRTLSSLSSQFKANSYHNGSIWPHDTVTIAEGMENFGFNQEAQKLRGAVLKAITHFRTPIELYVYDQTYRDYLSDRGQTSCKKQAWSAATILSSVAQDYKDNKVWFRLFPLEMFTDTFRTPLDFTNKLSRRLTTITTLPLKPLAPFYTQVRKLNYDKVKNTLASKMKMSS